MVARADIAEFSDRLANAFRPRKVVPFGSHAEGNARDDSDVDLLVEMEFEGNSRRMAARMIRRLRHYDAACFHVQHECFQKALVKRHHICVPGH